MEIEDDNKNFWPEFDMELTEDNEVTFVVQIDGKKRGLIKSNKDINEETLYELVLKEKSISKYLQNREIRKKIFIPNKLINIIM